MHDRQVMDLTSNGQSRQHTLEILCFQCNLRILPNQLHHLDHFSPRPRRLLGMREVLVESFGCLYEKVAQRCIRLPFICLSRGLLRKFWRHEDMLNNGGQDIGVDDSCGERHIVREVLYRWGTIVFPAGVDFDYWPQCGTTVAGLD
jgi:hypothetical protein